MVFGSSSGTVNISSASRAAISAWISARTAATFRSAFKSAAREARLSNCAIQASSHPELLFAIGIYYDQDNRIWQKRSDTTKDEANQRVIFSRRTIAIWEVMGGPLGECKETLAMIANEIAALKNIAWHHPEQAVADLVKRYEVLAAEQKLRLSQAPEERS